jgi:hypothetical protein
MAAPMSLLWSTQYSPLALAGTMPIVRPALFLMVQLLEPKVTSHLALTIWPIDMMVNPTVYLVHGGHLSIE